MFCTAHQAAVEVHRHIHLVVHTLLLQGMHSTSHGEVLELPSRLKMGQRGYALVMVFESWMKLEHWDYGLVQLPKRMKQLKPHYTSFHTSSNPFRVGWKGHSLCSRYFRL